jgi:hypothetical protein
MKRNYNFFERTMFIIAIVCGPALFSGCASSSDYINSENLIANNQAKILLSTGNTVSFDDEDGIIGKINGEIIVHKGETYILFPVNKAVNEFMFIVQSQDRGLIGTANKCAKAIIDYQFTAGETYLFQIHQSAGSRVGAAFLGALVPASFEYTIYAGSSYNKNNILLNGEMEKLDPDAIKTAGTGQNTVQNSPVPVPASQSAASEITGPYFVSVNDQPGGPYSLDELKQLAREEKLTKDSLIWKEGMAAWATAGTVAEFASFFSAVPPPLSPPGQSAPPAAPPPLPGQAVPPPLAASPHNPPVSDAAYRVGGRGPAGGVVFYDKGNNNDGWRYLEAAPQDIDKYYQWGLYREHTFTSAKIGEGKKNTQAILAQLVKGKEKDRAAQLCDSFSAGGFDDWFLPSRDELDALYKVMKGNNLLGGFKQNWYWTSTQEGKKNAYIIHMGSGKHDGTDKDHRNYIRPVRAF